MKSPRLRASRTTSAITAALAAVSLLAVAGCSTQDASADDGTKNVNLVAFSVIQSAYDDLGTSFEKTTAGQGVTVKGSYGASGAQSRAVIAGQDADVVALSLSPDVDSIATAGLVDPSWDSGKNKGIVSDSVVVLAVRKGNPKHIHSWADITKPGVGIVTADPGTSGSAKWNLLAAYSQALGTNNDTAAATDYLKKFVGNVVSWNDSGRTATDAFVAGTGDVLISYENEAIAARASGVALDYVVPSTTFLIQNPAALTTSAGPAARSFLDYVRSGAGQQILVQHGFRPVNGAKPAAPVAGANDPAHPFPTPKHLVTIDDLGGWSTVNAQLFDPETGLVAKLRG